MKKKQQVLVITGTRAEYGLLKSTIDEIRTSSKLELKLLVTGMHTVKRFGSTIQDIRADKIPIAAVVPIGEHDDMVTALSKELVGIQNYCKKHRPDLILVLGDRDEPFAAAIVAGHLQIPIAHIHGGDVSGYVVDSYIRDAITKFAHLHFAISPQSAERLLRLGEERRRIFHVGSPSVDVFRSIAYFNRREIAKQLHLSPEKKWFILLQHPVALDRISFAKQIRSTLDALSGTDAEIVAIYPNTDTGNEAIIRALEASRNMPGFHLVKNLPRRMYLSLFKESDLLIGNSSSGIIETGYFQLPTINIGNRQLHRECGKHVIHVGYDAKEIRRAITKALTPAFHRVCMKTMNPYGTGHAGKKIVKVIEQRIGQPELLYKDWLYER